VDAGYATLHDATTLHFHSDVVVNASSLAKSILVHFKTVSSGVAKPFSCIQFRDSYPAHSGLVTAVRRIRTELFLDLEGA
jgi:hypothetical protein